MKIGDLVIIRGNDIYGVIGVVTETAGKYLVVTDCDGQRYSMSQDYVEKIR